MGPVARVLLQLRVALLGGAGSETVEQLIVDALAQLAGVHRVHLAKEFRRHFGYNVSAYIRRRAVQRAAERMGTSHATLSDAAHASGFSDHAHMCHAFRREVGFSPAEVRRATAIKR